MMNASIQNHMVEAISHPKKRRPASEDGHIGSMYSSSGTVDFADQSPWRRIFDMAISRALHSEAAPARTQCSVQRKPSGGEQPSSTSTRRKIATRDSRLHLPPSQGKRHIKESGGSKDRRIFKYHSRTSIMTRGYRYTRARVHAPPPRVTLDHALRAVIHSLALNQKRAQCWRTLRRLEALGLSYPAWYDSKGLDEGLRGAGPFLARFH